jgi:hypothetical protein
LSAAGSAAQSARIDEDHSDAFIGPEEVDSVRPQFRVVAGAPYVVEPVVDADDYKAAVLTSDPGDEDEDEDGDEDWPEDLPEDLLDSASEIEVRIEDRESNKRRDPRSSILDPRSSVCNEKRRPGLKKLTKKQVALDWPPAPRGCEWRRSEEGLNLWRCWTEWDGDKNKRIKKSRYAGHLSDDAWRIMKEYDHEAFISIVGERLRRHGGR